MKALLINPPDINMIRTNAPDELEGTANTGFNPPLGLLYVAAYAEQNSNVEIEILDCQVDQLDFDDLKNEIRWREPDLVGIQAMTFTLIDVIETARVVKQVNRDIHVCLGGPHVNIFPDETISIVEVDSLVLGEGEYVFTDLLKSLESGRDLSNIQGIVFKKNGQVINTGARPLIKNLDELPQPARHLVPTEKYWSVLAKRSPVTTLMTSRGCPYKCIFCDRPHLGKSFRYRSAKSVVDEMHQCVDMGIREFILYDDTFTVNKQRVYDVCDEIIRRKLDIYWDVRSRVNGMGERLLKKMRRAGCIRIHFGIESGNQEILELLKKGITLEEARAAFEAAKKAGIATLAYFMLGNPSETKEQMLQTIEFAKTLRADYVHISLTTPFPATELYRVGLARGILKYDYWREFAKNPTKEFVPALWEEHLNHDELVETLRHAYRSFYSRPSYVLSQALKVRSWAELKKKAKTGLRLLKI